MGQACNWRVQVAQNPWPQLNAIGCVQVVTCVGSLAAGLVRVESSPKSNAPQHTLHTSAAIGASIACGGRTSILASGTGQSGGQGLCMVGGGHGTLMEAHGLRLTGMESAFSSVPRIVILWRFAGHDERVIVMS
jgi:hypothetical protein